jgi:anti-sigma B factor antagonist
MELTIQTLDQATIVTLVGDLDGSTAPRAQEEILALVMPECKILLEMSRVGYMSSIGLRTMLNLHRQADRVKGRFVLVSVSQEIQDTMSITGFGDFIKVYPTLGEGLAFLAQ